jgi:p-hydroxybenzoate 3-monooxygenase
VTGPSIEKSIAPLRSFVAEPMRFGRLFLAGEGRPHRAADRRQEPQSGRQRRLLSLAGLADFYDAKSTAGLDAYSDRALARVWQAERFSWMTMLLHRFPERSGFDQNVQRAELEYLARSQTAQAWLAENDVGLPY